ncbi:MAG TPA: ArsA-related P-loop ATPase [Actinomycetota bacterium]|jgi:anion-transporting  ArsA/GET3 family ATPase
MRADELLAQKHIVVCTGAGGVGKTTASAALALRAADAGRKVIVCTIDPARRLAQSLGLDGLKHDPTLVDASAFKRRKPKGELWAMMLDMKRTFDEMVLDLTSRDRAEAIFANPFYRHVSSTLAGTQEYMAMEKLWELHEEGRWELIVIDTPPTRNALDFLDAPRRLTDFFEGRFLRLMLWPYIKGAQGGIKLFNAGARAALRAVTKITGSELFSDVADFFVEFEGMYEQFKRRAVAVHELLGAKHTSFVVVTAPTEPSLREARFFADRLQQEKMPLGALLVNRTHDVPDAPGLQDPRALVAQVGGGPLADALAVYADWRTVAAREQRLLNTELGALGSTSVWRVPDLADDVNDAAALREIGELLATA